jgi:hypothetical protein
MTRVRVCVDIADEHYRQFQAEARRRDVPVESLIEQCVAGLVRELEQEESDGTDHPVVMT